MGTWGPHAFENASALDLIAEVADGGGLARLEEAIDRILAATDDLDASDAEAGLAAGAILAVMAGRGDGSEVPEDLAGWLAEAGTAPPALLAKARKAAARTLAEGSELAELWNEGPDAEIWRDAVNDLIERL
ncbi:DUF4259 domain-containing protein [Prosthecomicrobium hirschii]|uniref:DUF4259 domain-containing protein n=1 Tax=Prosthecodimorpha hirschii TaxID=665126 RepID=UPI00221FE0C5|nr:DUF4259 domain-containing protein [Prosthecomicrobium hirschii]MCW1841022.1 DUF4259 domain-containing protein [Prosthecomicrobium hirschii]